jgi:hypothetical protein
MKSVHVSSIEIFHKHMLNFSHSQAMHLANGHCVIIGDIHPTLLEAFEQEGAITLPFALSNDPVGPRVAGILSEHRIKENDRTMDVLAQVAKVHKAFHPNAVI